MPTLDAAQLAERARIAHERLRACDLCPRGCGVDRTNGELGFCRVGARAIVASYGPHFGEERPLVGRRGSGTVFFSGCNLACEFCQNEEISHGLAGGETTSEELAAIFLAVQRSGCHNLNLVTPTHVVPQWLDALAQARAHGFDLPVVYNTGGYDRVDTLQLLDGAVEHLPARLQVHRRGRRRAAGARAGLSDRRAGGAA
jgi:putative pyruvate formate lyase activating enzyme